MAGARRKAHRSGGLKRTASAVAIPVTGLALVISAAGAVAYDGPQGDRVVSSAAQFSDHPAAEVVATGDYLRTDADRTTDGRITRPSASAGETMFIAEESPIRTAPSGQSRPQATLEAGEEIVVTGEVVKGYAQVIHEGTELWVKEDRLNEDEPDAGGDSGSSDDETRAISNEPCPRAAGVENGLQPDAVRTLRAVCAEFPEVQSYGGLAGRNDHALGQAVDVMISSDTGTEIAQFLIDNAAELGVNYVIWRQQIYTIDRPGWRAMEDRGGATANHYDHVHVSTHVDSGTGG